MSDEKLAVYMSNKALKQLACQYYRIEVPARTLHSIGKADIFIDTGEIETDLALQAMTVSDIIQFWGISGKTWLDTFSVIKDMKPGSDSKGDLIYPPSIVYDIDDNLEYTHPFNNAFGTIGVRNVDGSKLNPGDSIWTETAAGKEVCLWEDRVTVGDSGKVFDIARNWETVGSANAIAKMVDGVTVPVEPLANYFKTVHGIKNVYVYPNSVVEDDYYYPNLAPREDGSIRILWQGGSSHMADWYALRDGLREICQKYPNVKFVIFGTVYDWIFEVIPANQIEKHEWVPYAGYKYLRSILDIDINLCPLAPTIFNKCKSAIKWYEASIGPRPEATLASNFGPYKEIEDGKTGMLFNTPEEFVTKLSALIENKELRKDIANNAREWVRNNRTATKTAVGLAEFYEELRAQKRAHFSVEV